MFFQISMYTETQFHLDSVIYPTLSTNTAMQASLSVGQDVPRFCYHEKLSIAGNCRMCLLEISYPKTLKPMASCALPLMTNMSIYSNTVMVKKAREGVLELILINHPLDCPVCDQGGECDLQEETLKFGGDRARFSENKRAVKDKDCGPTIKTSMNRCIHCTKCVRFCAEICGESTLGTLGRGFYMEIGTFIDEILDSELSGNLSDVCPVGALTSKPYAFKARPWELRSFETFDIIDSFASNIRVDIRGTSVVRILPSQADDLNEDWITDRTRFCYDGLKIQRLHSPMIKISGEFIHTNWETAFSIASFFLNSFSSFNSGYFSTFLNKKSSIIGLFGDLVDSETLVILNDFFHELGSSIVISQNFLNLNLDFRSNYLLNLSLNYVEKADLFILVGLNMRLELPLLNLRIRKSFLNNNSPVISFGFSTSLTYNFFQQGNNNNSVFRFLNGKSYASKCLIDSKFPIIFIGTNLSKNFSNNFFLNFFFSLNKYSNLITSQGWHGLNFIDPKIVSQASRDLSLQYTGLNDILFLKNSFIYLCGVENLDFLQIKNSLNFIIFQGHTGNDLAFSSDIIFPGCNFIEKESLYLSLQGKLQKTKFLLNAPSFARVDWKIIAGFRIFFFDKYLIKDSTVNLRQLHTLDLVRKRLLQYSKSFFISEFLTHNLSHKSSNFFTILSLNKYFLPFVYVYNMFFTNNSQNLYLNNSITQVSKILGVCASRYNNKQSNFNKNKK